jgi:RHS repeat-associated protein
MIIGQAGLGARQRSTSGLLRSGLPKSALLPALLAATFMTAPTAAAAQEPPMFRNLDENGIDMGTGLYHSDHVALSIGDGPAALQLRVKVDQNGVHTNFDGLSTIDMDADGGWFAETWFEDDRNNYLGAGPSWSSEEGDGATLVKSGNNVTWTKSDGTTILFRTDIDNWHNGTVGYPTEITFPGGHKIKISYKVDSSLAIVRVQSVISSQGYQLKFSYAGSPNNLVATIKAINNGVEYCDPAADACGGLTQSWPSVQVASSIPGPYQGFPSGPDPMVFIVTNSKNDSTTYTYAAQAQPMGTYVHPLTGIRRPGSTSDNVTFNYDSGGLLTAVTRDGITYSYSNAGTTVSAPKLTRTNPAAGTLVVVSDPMGMRPVSIKDEANRTTTFTYDPYMRLKRKTEPEGNYTQYTYDWRGSVTEVRQVAKPGTGLADIVTSATYSATCTNALVCNQPITTTDAHSNVTNYSYDPATGLPTAVTGPAVGGVRPEMRYTYSARQAYLKDSSGAIVASGMPVSVPTRISACRTASTCAATADEAATIIDYGLQSAGTANNLNIASITTGGGDGALTATTGFGYDSVGNRITIDGPLAGTADTTRLRYDSEHQRVGVTGPDPDGTGALKPLAVRTSYNPNGQVTKVERGTVDSQSDSDWAAMTAYDTVDFSYDSNARRVKSTLTAGGSVQNAVQYSYDSLGRTECVAQRMNTDAFGSLPASACSLGTEGTFGPDRIVKTSYNAVGQVTEVRSGVGTAIEAPDSTSTYSNNRQLATATDGENNKTSFEYDGHDRLWRTYFPSSTKGAGASSSTYEQYDRDSNGNVTARRLRDGYSLTFGYDAMNRMTTKIVPERPGLAATYTRDVYYSYDLLGRQTDAHFDSVSGEGVGAAYDALGRVSSTTTNMGGNSRTISYQYDLAGNRTRITHPPAILPDRPDVGPLTFIYNYQYDLLGRPTLVTNAGGAQVSGWVYDVRGRLDQIIRPGAPPTVYGYDAASRVSSIAYDLYGTSVDMTLSYTYNPANQVVSRTSTNDAYASTANYNLNRPYGSNGLNQYTSAGLASFTYDVNGNLISDGSTAFVYDVENRLVSASGARNATLLYDPLGRLHQVTGSSGWLQFLFDGDALIGEYDGAQTRPRTYVHGVGTDVPVTWYEGAGGGRRMYADHEGSIVAIAHATNGYLAINGYDEYGIPNAGNQGRFQYTGQIWLPELGMYYYKARMYSPTLGRFMQTDPIGYAGGMNLYQ